eukprot:11135134-Ditylum_brightwellii.AAC.1
MARVPVSKGANKGGGFCPQEPSSIQQVFLITLGFSSFSPNVFYLQGWGSRAKLSSDPQATAPHLYQNQQEQKKQRPHPFSKGGHQATVNKREQNAGSLPKYTGGCDHTPTQLLRNASRGKGGKRQRSLPKYQITSRRMEERGRDPSPGDTSFALQSANKNTLVGTAECI